MNVLIACEESQIECIEFRKRGFTCFSCDIQKCSGGFPEWHIVADVLSVLYPPCDFVTENGDRHYIDKWDLVIAHPPCTYLCRSQAQYVTPTSKTYRPERMKDVVAARDFFMKFLDLDCPVAVENPVPVKISGLPQHSCCAQPYEFGHPYSKLTYYWTRGLPPLFPTCIVLDHIDYVMSIKSSKDRSKLRSKSFPGIAAAMADQWGDYIKNKR